MDGWMDGWRVTFHLGDCSHHEIRKKGGLNSPFSVFFPTPILALAVFLASSRLFEFVLYYALLLIQICIKNGNSCLWAFIAGNINVQLQI